VRSIGGSTGRLDTLRQVARIDPHLRNETRLGAELRAPHHNLKRSPTSIFGIGGSASSVARSISARNQAGAGATFTVNCRRERREAVRQTECRFPHSMGEGSRGRRP
jgi:hypothetical protein